MNPSNTTLQVRLNQKEKIQVKKVLDGLGIDFSTAIKIYFNKIIHTKGIPFALTTENGFTPEQEKQLIKESNETLRLYKSGKIKGYTDTKEFIQDILK